MEIVREGAKILIGAMNVDARNLVSIGGGALVRTDDQEKLDLAFVRLPGSAIKALAPFKRFVELSEVDLRPPMPYGPPMPQGLYYVAGYPVQLTHTDNSDKMITVGQYTHTTHLVDSDSAHRGISIAVAYGKDSTTRSVDGQCAPAPKLNGVSGCGIWRLWENEHVEQLAGWDESWIRLTGIEHRIAGEAIIGTMASHVIKLLIHTQPVELTLSHDVATLRLR